MNSLQRLQFAIAISICLVSLGSSPAATVLYSSSSLPHEQGWTQVSYSGEPLFVSPAVEGAIVVDDGREVLSVATEMANTHYYRYDTEFAQFLTTFRVRVDEATHNSFDAGFMLSILSSEFGPADRTNGLYVLPDRIGFMDDSEPAHLVDAREYHDYSLLMLGNNLEVFVDALEERILDGSAQAALSRTIRDSVAGKIRFGDQTNDMDVNSSYKMESVLFTPISTIVECSGDGLLDALDLECSCNSEVLEKLNLLPGDFDGNGIVDFSDFVDLSNNYGKSANGHNDGDVDCDGSVGFNDFLLFSHNFGKTSAPISEGALAAVPESSGASSTVSMLAIFSLVWRRQRRDI